MIRNYFKTAIRNILRHRFFSFINIFGLALGMSICMAIMMIVADQMQYDRYNTKRDVIYRVTSIATDANLQPITGDGITFTTLMPLRDELEKYSGIDKVVRFKRGFGNNWMEFEEQDVNVPLAGYFADPGALQMFEYELQYGDASTALNDPYSVVLTRKAANKIFSEDNPVGKTIRVGELGLYTITGVLKETEHKTHIAFEALASMSSLVSLDAQGKFDGKLGDWNDFWNTWTYIQVEPGTTTTDIQSFLDKIFESRIAGNPDPEANKLRFQLQGLMEITPGPMGNRPIGPSLPWIFIKVLGGLAAIIMIVSCFNFTNLSVARSLTRAREIGVRKVNGASRFQIFGQFISEAIVISLCALVLSIGLLLALKPMFLQLNLARVFRWNLESNYEVYGLFLGFAIFVGILAGLFPSLVLSGFKPVTVLKSVTSMKLFSRMGLRKALLVSQFTLALVFILSVTALYNQFEFVINKDHGFDMENQLCVYLNKTSSGPLKNELLKHNNIVNVSAASHLPAAGEQQGEEFIKSGEKEKTFAFKFDVDENYATSLGLEIVAGKFFDEANPESNKKFVVLNEKAVKEMLFPTPFDAIGSQLIRQSDSVAVTVIGVVKDYNHMWLLSTLEACVLQYQPNNFQVLQVKYTGTFEEASAIVAQAWSKINPGFKADVRDMKSEVMMAYDTILGDAVEVLGFIAFLAIVISCLGLLGMATYSTETRIKEVSIRKVLGSTNVALIYLLSKSFLVIILIAIILGAPAAYFLNTMWLEFMPFHVTMSLPMISFGVLMLVLFAVITVGSQTYRATFVNPVDNLKNE